MYDKIFEDVKGDFYEREEISPEKKEEIRTKFFAEIDNLPKYKRAEACEKFYNEYYEKFGLEIAFENKLNSIINETHEGQFANLKGARNSFLSKIKYFPRSLQAKACATFWYKCTHFFDSEKSIYEMEQRYPGASAEIYKTAEKKGNEILLDAKKYYMAEIGKGRDSHVVQKEMINTFFDRDLTPFTTNLKEKIAMKFFKNSENFLTKSNKEFFTEKMTEAMGGPGRA